MGSGGNRTICKEKKLGRQRHSNKTEVRPLGHECQASCLGGTHFTNCANLRHARLPTATPSDGTGGDGTGRRD